MKEYQKDIEISEIVPKLYNFFEDLNENDDNILSNELYSKR